jgi:hypothetical protein
MSARFKREAATPINAGLALFGIEIAKGDRYRTQDLNKQTWSATLFASPIAAVQMTAIGTLRTRHWQI